MFFSTLSLPHSGVSSPEILGAVLGSQFKKKVKMLESTHRRATKLLQGRFKLGIRNNCSIARVAKYWNRLTREVVDVPYLPVFKQHLDNALKLYVLSSGLTVGTQSL